MQKKRATMIKPVLGKVRAPSYRLPDSDFVFGVATESDKEGADKVLQSWAQSEPSRAQLSEHSFPATNREAVKHGCLTAKAQRDFAKNNPVSKQNAVASTRKKHCAAVNDSHRIFGVRSAKNDASMKELLQSKPSEFEEIDYPDQSHMRRKGKLPPAKSTRSSRLFQEHVTPRISEEAAAQKAKAEFKIKKFLKVESKVKLMMQR